MWVRKSNIDSFSKKSLEFEIVNVTTLAECMLDQHRGKALRLQTILNDGKVVSNFIVFEAEFDERKYPINRKDQLTDNFDDAIKFYNQII